MKKRFIVILCLLVLLLISSCTVTPTITVTPTPTHTAIPTPTNVVTPGPTGQILLADTISLDAYDDALFQSYNHSQEAWTSPFNKAGFYWSNQFFIEANQEAEVAITSQYATSVTNQLDKDQFGGGLKVTVMRNKGSYSGSLDGSEWKVERKSSANSCVTSFTFVAPGAGYCSLWIMNDSGKPTWCNFSIH